MQKCIAKYTFTHTCKAEAFMGKHKNEKENLIQKRVSLKLSTGKLYFRESIVIKQENNITCKKMNPVSIYFYNSDRVNWRQIIHIMHTNFSEMLTWSQGLIF